MSTEQLEDESCLIRNSPARCSVISRAVFSNSQLQGGYSGEAAGSKGVPIQKVQPTKAD